MHTEREATLENLAAVYDAVPGPFQVLTVPTGRSPVEHLDAIRPSVDAVGKHLFRPCAALGCSSLVGIGRIGCSLTGMLRGAVPATPVGQSGRRISNQNLTALDQMSDAAAQVILLLSKRNFAQDPLVAATPAAQHQALSSGSLTGGGEPVPGMTEPRETRKATAKSIRKEGWPTSALLSWCLRDLE